MQSKIFLFFLILVVGCLTQFATDIYAPSLPALSDYFGTLLKLPQFSLAIYMAGVALSQLIYGPLSEGFGRKAPLLSGLLIMMVGSLMCVFATKIEWLIIGRVIQGIGAGAGASLWRAIFRDIYTAEELAKYGSYAVLIVIFIVPMAPALGGYLQHYFGWRASFVFIAIYCVVAFLAIFFCYRETSQHHHRDKLKWTFIGKTYGSFFKSRIFLGATICSFFSYGAFFAWFTVGSILMIKRAGLNPVQFGWFTLVGGGFGYAVAGWLNGRYVSRFGMTLMMRFGWSLMILSGMLMLVLLRVNGTTFWAIAVPVVLFYFGSTFIWPNAFATAFTPFGHIAGYAGALYGFMQLGGAAVIGVTVAHLPSNNQLPLGLVFIMGSAIAWLIYEIMVRPAMDFIKKSPIASVTQA